jgi:hypothetical protein
MAFLCFFINVNYGCMNDKKKLCVTPLEPPPTQTNARMISTIWADANGHDVSVSTSEIRRSTGDALILGVAKEREDLKYGDAQVSTRLRAALWRIATDMLSSAIVKEPLVPPRVCDT